MSTDDNAAKDSGQSGETLAQTMQALRSVNEKAPEAKQNKDSMEDRDGRRIKFNEGDRRRGTIQGVDS